MFLLEKFRGPTEMLDDLCFFSQNLTNKNCSCSEWSIFC